MAVQANGRIFKSSETLFVIPILDKKISFRHKIWDFDQHKECCQFYKLMKQFNIIQ